MRPCRGQVCYLLQLSLLLGVGPRFDCRIWLLQNAPYVLVEASSLNIPFVHFDIGGILELIVMEPKLGRTMFTLYACSPRRNAKLRPLVLLQSSPGMLITVQLQQFLSPRPWKNSCPTGRPPSHGFNHSQATAPRCGWTGMLPPRGCPVDFPVLCQTRSRANPCTSNQPAPR